MFKQLRTQLIAIKTLGTFSQAVAGKNIQCFFPPEHLGDLFNCLRSSGSRANVVDRDLSVLESSSNHDADRFGNDGDNASQVAFSSYYGDVMKLLNVVLGLSVKSLKSIAFALDFVRMQGAVDHSNVGTSCVIQKSKLVDDQCVRLCESLRKLRLKHVSDIDVSHSELQVANPRRFEGLCRHLWSAVGRSPFSLHPKRKFDYEPA